MRKSVLGLTRLLQVAAALLAENAPQGDIKIDWQVTERNHIFGRESAAHKKYTNPSPANMFMFGGPNSEALNQNAVLGWDRTFSPAVVNELRVGFNRFKSCRREMLDHVIPLNERHLRGLLRAYVSYHNQDRIHDALYKDAPNPRPVVSARLLPKLRYRKCGLATQSGGLTSAGLTQDAKLPPLERLAARILIFNLF